MWLARRGWFEYVHMYVPHLKLATLSCPGTSEWKLKGGYSVIYCSVGGSSHLGALTAPDPSSKRK